MQKKEFGDLEMEEMHLSLELSNAIHNQLTLDEVETDNGKSASISQHLNGSWW